MSVFTVSADITFKTAYILLSSTATCFGSFWLSSGGFYRNMRGQEYRGGGTILFLEESGLLERDAVSPRCFPTFRRNVVPSTSRVGGSKKTYPVAQRRRRAFKCRYSFLLCAAHFFTEHKPHARYEIIFCSYQ